MQEVCPGVLFYVGNTGFEMWKVHVLEYKVEISEDKRIT